MSRTTMTSAESATEPRSVTLHNGQVLSFKSNVSTTLEKIPVIDASKIWCDCLSDRQAVAEEIREASRTIGFFYLINHDIDEKYAEGCFAQAKRFFALPEEKKMEVWTGKLPTEYAGYHPMAAYNRNGWKYHDLNEAFNWPYDPRQDPEVADDSHEPSPSLWPSGLPGFRDGLYAYQLQLLRLSRQLTRIFALALYLPEDYFDQYIKRPEAGMRILHYPEQENGIDDQNGIGAHTDVECFTIVNQDTAGGLEVLSKSGNWVKADPVPGAFVVNIADCFMRQTNDFFVSTVHRVINKSGKERYSAAFFFGFDKDKQLEPVPSCISEENPMKYPIMTGGEYSRFRVSKVKGY
ncbi:putative gibberellin 3-beta hydroxylase [Diaporthe sp. PMI_573]|nr:putative gibberellin 3-beta hydroxylase [Diaporthaceae sp. PMI_573]